MSQQVMTYNATGLSNEQILRHCPAIFAEAKHESRSKRYAYLPTKDLLDALRGRDFVPTMAMQSKSRVQGKEAFTKHLLRFRHSSELGNTRPDVREVVLVNSHDGTSSYQLMQGVFRIACTNGLITGDIDRTLRVPHVGDIANRVVEGSLTILDESEQTMRDVETMKRIPLKREQQLLLSEFAMRVRFDLDEEQEHAVDAKPVLYQPVDFLRIRRDADEGDDLYTTMNRIQENILKGGVRRLDTRGQVHTTRPIKGIDQTVKINRLLWQFTERMMQTLG